MFEATLALLMADPDAFEARPLALPEFPGEVLGVEAEGFWIGFTVVNAETVTVLFAAWPLDPP